MTKPQIDVKQGRETDLELLLHSGVLLVQNEPSTSVWLVMRMSHQHSVFLVLFSMILADKNI
ncbi:MAG TPA: hypothetical protein VN704_00690 [Verrucomicrobiae bacterium]|nr:hypothetical protein [Verrucomicrobiae bacterium]